MRYALVALAGLIPAALPGQGYRLRVDLRAQGAAYRGVALDSIPVTDTVTSSTGGPQTVDGYAVTCVGADPYCFYYRPGPARRGGPVTGTVDFAAWGLGTEGLSVRGTARVGGALGRTDVWPGTEPAVQLLEGYAEYATEALTGQLGRQTVVTRFGYAGFDGARVAVRRPRWGAVADAYLGWGLARGAAVPVNSPVLDPLDDYEPSERQVIAGLGAGWRRDGFEVGVSYQRQVDGRSQYLTAERAGLDASVRPVRDWAVVAGADYDLAAGVWGSAEATITYAPPAGRVNAALGARRYRPQFDLWTIWGAFNPVPYRAAYGSVSTQPLEGVGLRLRGRLERYAFDAAQTATPLVTVETDGWRLAWGASYAPAPAWIVDAGYREEFGPGAASRGFEASVGYAAGDGLDLRATAAALERPLEFRYNQASVTLLGLAADYRPTTRLTVQVDASRILEARDRPDAAAFDWNQTRVSLRVVFQFGQGADLSELPPAVRGMPERSTDP